jgi:hypothetical protein
VLLFGAGAYRQFVQEAGSAIQLEKSRVDGLDEEPEEAGREGESGAAGEGTGQKKRGGLKQVAATLLDVV